MYTVEDGSFENAKEGKAAEMSRIYLINFGTFGSIGSS